MSQDDIHEVILVGACVANLAWTSRASGRVCVVAPAWGRRRRRFGLPMQAEPASEGWERARGRSLAVHSTPRSILPDNVIEGGRKTLSATVSQRESVEVR